MLWLKIIIWSNNACTHSLYFALGKSSLIVGAYLFLYSALCSLIIASIIIYSSALHGRFTHDHDLHSIQKFHTKPVSRIGGVALFVTLVLSYLILPSKVACAHPLLLLLIASSPIFLTGVAEDIRKNITPRFRLCIGFLSAGLTYVLLHTSFNRIGYPWLDTLLAACPMLSLMITMFAIGGMVQAMNIIDGFNGLMLGISLLILGDISIISYLVDDAIILPLALIFAGTITGLFLLNFPAGKIFAGDGGAYLIGFLLCTLTFMLVNRHPNISAWFPALLFSYPIFETLFSIYRKTILKKTTSLQPDGAHLHMLIYKNIYHKLATLPYSKHKRMLLSHALTAMQLWLLSLIGMLPIILYWENTIMLILYCLLFAAGYLIMYERNHTCLSENHVPLKEIHSR